MTTAYASAIKTKQAKQKLNNQREKGTMPKNDNDWRSQAACKNLPKNIFFPEQPSDNAYKQAQKICGSCPVQQDCLAMALKHESGERCRYGMFGGHTPKERYLMDKTGEQIPRRPATPITTPPKELPHWLGKRPLR
jgi:WhiB family redox-sensing transcriptional regulator